MNFIEKLENMKKIWHDKYAKRSQSTSFQFRSQDNYRFQRPLYSNQQAATPAFKSHNNQFNAYFNNQQKIQENVSELRPFSLSYRRSLQLTDGIAVNQRENTPNVGDRFQGRSGNYQSNFRRANQKSQAVYQTNEVVEDDQVDVQLEYEEESCLEEKTNSDDHSNQQVEANHIIPTLRSSCRRCKSEFSFNNRLHDHLQSCRVKSFSLSSSETDVFAVTVESDAPIIKSNTSTDASSDLGFRN